MHKYVPQYYAIERGHNLQTSMWVGESQNYLDVGRYRIYVVLHDSWPHTVLHQAMPFPIDQVFVGLESILNWFQTHQTSTIVPSKPSTSFQLAGGAKLHRPAGMSKWKWPYPKYEYRSVVLFHSCETKSLASTSMDEINVHFILTIRRI